MSPQPHNSSNAVSATQDTGTARLALTSALVASVISVSAAIPAGVFGGDGGMFLFWFFGFPTAAFVGQLMAMSRYLRGLYRGGHVLMALFIAVAALAIGVPASIFCGFAVGAFFLPELAKVIGPFALWAPASWVPTPWVLALIVTASVASGVGFLVPELRLGDPHPRSSASR